MLGNMISNLAAVKNKSTLADTEIVGTNRIYRTISSYCARGD